MFFLNICLLYPPTRLMVNTISNCDSQRPLQDPLEILKKHIVLMLFTPGPCSWLSWTPHSAPKGHLGASRSSSGHPRTLAHLSDPPSTSADTSPPERFFNREMAESSISKNSLSVHGRYQNSQNSLSVGSGT